MVEAVHAGVGGDRTGSISIMMNSLCFLFREGKLTFALIVCAAKSRPSSGDSAFVISV